MDDNSQQPKIQKLLEIYAKTNSLCSNMKHMTFNYDDVYSSISLKSLIIKKYK
jgi:hypothetical protein